MTNYEFGESQNQLIKDLASKMQFVGYFLIVTGVLVGVGAILTLLDGGSGAFGGLIQAIAQIVIGVWTKNASDAFGRIVTTQGNDIENLMNALAELRKLYTLQYWLLIIAIVFIAIALVLGLIFGLSR